MQIDASKVSQIYLGRDKICRCGCFGEYVQPGEPKFEKRLKRFMKMVCDYVPSKDDVCDSYVNISYGNDRAMTVYFK